MTETDYVKEQLSILKIAMTGVVGAGFAVAVYKFQNPGSNSFAAIATILFLGCILAILGRKIIQVADYLRALPKE